jgi:hypothetical protein
MDLYYIRAAGVVNEGNWEHNAAQGAKAAVGPLLGGAVE